MRSLAIVGALIVASYLAEANDGISAKEPPFAVSTWRKKYYLPTNFDLLEIVQCTGDDGYGLQGADSSTFTYLWTSSRKGTSIDGRRLYRLIRVNTADSTSMWIRKFFAVSDNDVDAYDTPVCFTDNTLLLKSQKRFLSLDVTNGQGAERNWGLEFGNSSTFGQNPTIVDYVVASPVISISGTGSTITSRTNSPWVYIMWTSDNWSTDNKRPVYTIGSFNVKTGSERKNDLNYTDVNGCGNLAFSRHESNIFLAMICKSVKDPNNGNENTDANIFIRYARAPVDAMLGWNDYKTITPKDAKGKANATHVDGLQFMNGYVYLCLATHGRVQSWDLNNARLQLNHNSRAFNINDRPVKSFAVGSVNGGEFFYMLNQRHMLTYKLEGATRTSSTKVHQKTYTAGGTISVIGSIRPAGGEYGIGEWIISERPSDPQADSYWFHLYDFTTQLHRWCSQLPFIKDQYADIANYVTANGLSSYGLDFVQITPRKVNAGNIPDTPTYFSYFVDRANGDVLFQFGFDQSINSWGWDSSTQRLLAISNEYHHQIVPSATGRGYQLSKPSVTSTFLNGDLYMTDGSTLRRYTLGGDISGNTDGSYNGVPSVGYSSNGNPYSYSYSGYSSQPIGPTPTPTSLSSSSPSVDGAVCEYSNYGDGNGKTAPNYQSPISVWYISLGKAQSGSGVEFINVQPAHLQSTNELLYVIRETGTSNPNYYFAAFHAETGRFIRRIRITDMVSKQNCGSFDGTVAKGTVFYVDQSNLDVFWVAGSCLIRMNRFAIFTAGSAPGSATLSGEGWLNIVSSRYVVVIAETGGGFGGPTDTTLVRFDRLYLGNPVLGVKVGTNKKDIACGSPSRGMIALGAVWVVCGTETNILASFSIDGLYRHSYTSLMGSSLSTDFGHVAPWLYNGDIYIAGNTGTVISTRVLNGINSSVTTNWVTQTPANFSLGAPVIANDGIFVFAPQPDKTRSFSTENQGGLYVVDSDGNLLWTIIDRMEWSQARSWTCKNVTVSLNVIIAICNEQLRFINLWNGDVVYSGPSMGAMDTQQVQVVGAPAGQQQVYQMTSDQLSFTSVGISYPDRKKGLSAGAIAGIVLGTLVAVGLIAGIGGGVAMKMKAGGAAAGAAAASSSSSPTTKSVDAEKPLLDEGKSAGVFEEKSADIPDNGSNQEMAPSEQKLKDEEPAKNEA